MQDLQHGKLTENSDFIAGNNSTHLQKPTPKQGTTNKKLKPKNKGTGNQRTRNLQGAQR